MTLKYGFRWQGLYDSKQLKRLQDSFLLFLVRDDPDLYSDIYEKGQPLRLHIIPLAMAIERFVVVLFNIEGVAQSHYDVHDAYRFTSHFKRNFIQRDALHAYSGAETLDGSEILGLLSGRLGEYVDPCDEGSFAQLGLAALSREDVEAVELFRRYSAWAYYSEAGKARHLEGFLFKKPGATIQFQRFPIQKDDHDVITSPKLNLRTGFDLTDKGVDAAKAVDEAFYCIKCHDRGKDTCRTGFKTDGAEYKNDEFGQPLSGCPLDQKISEMNVLFEHGQLIAALAVVTLDNPMVAATGHRICYDCSRSCIFQKQDPVDIPSIETRLLKQVLDLPYGFEIYSLLTRWNPLNIDTPYPKTNSGHHVLVVGQGPTGFALSHLLMQRGHKITAIDGLKIEPLPSELKDPSKPIYRINDCFEALSERYAKGFGGVAEYGITARWEKNFLLVIRLLLERQALYQCLDGVRFGSSLTFDSAFNHYGFDHVALCLGAGSPTMLPLENMTVPGVRLASDFLMALHLGDAAKLHTKTTLRIQLPLAVIGGGLTAVDTATEALAYYPQQVMNFYKRYIEILSTKGDVAAKAMLGADPEVAAEFLQHGKILLDETALAKAESRTPNYLPYLNEWGGVTIYYRKKLHEAPSYRLNPHEIQKALMEGVRFVEDAFPNRIVVNDDQRLDSVEFSVNGEIKSVSLKTLLIAAGTKPNTVLANEFPELCLDGGFFRPLAGEELFVVKTDDGRYVSYLGDLHPKYSGSVVKALASAKMAAPKIHEKLVQYAAKGVAFETDDFVSTVYAISIENDVVRLTVRSVAAARTYQSGQFYKLQPYGTAYTESIPLSPVEVDKHEGILRFNIKVVGASTRRLQKLQLSERIFLMGPAGSKLNIPQEHRLLVLVDPQSPAGITDPVLKHIQNECHQLIASVEQLSSADFQGFDSVFVVGSAVFIARLIASFSPFPIPVYTHVQAHLQCMMKEVCAQCVYTVKDSETGITSVQFGCAKSIESLENFSYLDVNKRNKNERMEETLLAHWAAVINSTHD